MHSAKAVWLGPVLFALIGSNDLRADSVSLAPSADTTLFGKFPGNNLGATDSIVSGAVGSGQNSRGLLKFDIAGAIPGGATINSATLTLTVTKIPFGSVGSTFDLRSVLVNWGEGTKGFSTGQPAGAGEATWNAPLTSVTGWSTGTPGGAIGSDFSSTVSAAQAIGGFGSYTFTSTPALVGDVQSWLNNPANNFGWALISESEGTLKTAHRFGSSENAFAAPSLQVNFTPVPEPASLALLALGGLFLLGRPRSRGFRKP